MITEVLDQSFYNSIEKKNLMLNEKDQAHKAFCEERIRRFLTVLKFRLVINKVVSDRKRAKFVLQNAVYIFRNKKRGLTIRERNRWFYFCWYKSAVNKR